MRANAIAFGSRQRECDESPRADSPQAEVLARAREDGAVELAAEVAERVTMGQLFGAPRVVCVRVCAGFSDAFWTLAKG